MILGCLLLLLILNRYGFETKVTRLQRPSPAAVATAGMVAGKITENLASVLL